MMSLKPVWAAIRHNIDTTVWTITSKATGLRQFRVALMICWRSGCPIVLSFIFIVLLFLRIECNFLAGPPRTAVGRCNRHFCFQPPVDFRHTLMRPSAHARALVLRVLKVQRSGGCEVLSGYELSLQGMN